MRLAIKVSSPKQHKELWTVQDATEESLYTMHIAAIENIYDMQKYHNKTKIITAEFQSQCLPATDARLSDEL